MLGMESGNITQSKLPLQTKSHTSQSDVVETFKKLDRNASAKSTTIILRLVEQLKTIANEPDKFRKTLEKLSAEIDRRQTTSPGSERILITNIAAALDMVLGASKQKPALTDNVIRIIQEISQKSPSFLRVQQEMTTPEVNNKAESKTEIVPEEMSKTTISKTLSEQYSKGVDLENKETHEKVALFLQTIGENNSQTLTFASGINREEALNGFFSMLETLAENEKTEEMTHIFSILVNGHLTLATSDGTLIEPNRKSEVREESTKLREARLSKKKQDTSSGTSPKVGTTANYGTMNVYEDVTDEGNEHLKEKQKVESQDDSDPRISLRPEGTFFLDEQGIYYKGTNNKTFIWRAEHLFNIKGDIQTGKKEITLGEGTFGKVRTLGDTLVIKKSHHDETEGFDLHKTLDHPGIIKAHIQIRDGDTTFTLLEKVPGFEIQDIIKYKALTNLHSSPQLVSHLLTQLLEALKYLHDQGITYRDLKWLNVMVRADDAGVKLIDMASATKTHEDVIGSPYWMAPEAWTVRHDDSQPEQKITLGPKLDIWSFGIMLFELATGKNPIQEYGTRFPEEYRQYQRPLGFDRLMKAVDEQKLKEIQTHLEAAIKDPKELKTAQKLLEAAMKGPNELETLKTHLKTAIKDPQVLKKLETLLEETMTSEKLKEVQMFLDTAIKTPKKEQKLVEEQEDRQLGDFVRDFTPEKLMKMLDLFNVTGEIRDLIIQCVAIDPEKRPTIDDVLQHPYFKRKQSDQESSVTDVWSQFVKKFNDKKRIYKEMEKGSPEEFIEKGKEGVKGSIKRRQAEAVKDIIEFLDYQVGQMFERPVYGRISRDLEIREELYNMGIFSEWFKNSATYSDSHSMAMVLNYFPDISEKKDQVRSLSPELCKNLMIECLSIGDQKNAELVLEILQSDTEQYNKVRDSLSVGITELIADNFKKFSVETRTFLSRLISTKAVEVKPESVTNGAALPFIDSLIPGGIKPELLKDILVASIKSGDIDNTELTFGFLLLNNDGYRVVKSALTNDIFSYVNQNQAAISKELRPFLERQMEITLKIGESHEPQLYSDFSPAIAKALAAVADDKKPVDQKVAALPMHCLGEVMLESIKIGKPDIAALCLERLQSDKLAFEQFKSGATKMIYENVLEKISLNRKLQAPNIISFLRQLVDNGLFTFATDPAYIPSAKVLEPLNKLFPGKIDAKFLKDLAVSFIKKGDVENADKVLRLFLVSEGFETFEKQLSQEIFDFIVQNYQTIRYNDPLQRFLEQLVREEILFHDITHLPNSKIRDYDLMRYLQELHWH